VREPLTLVRQSEGFCPLSSHVVRLDERGRCSRCHVLWLRRDGFLVCRAEEERDEEGVIAQQYISERDLEHYRLTETMLEIWVKRVRALV
jgi:hypothetical protein